MPHYPDMLSLALAEPSRRALLESLRFGQKSVSELVQATGFKQPNVSNHLAKMRLHNIVRAERVGRKVYYSIALPVAELLLRLHEFTLETLREESAQKESGALLLFAGNGHALPSGQKARKANGLSAGLPESLPLAEWRDLFFQSLLAGQEDRAQALVHEMLARRASLPVIYTEVFHAAINQIGELYEQGAVDEAQEHLASALTERMMARVAHFHTPVFRVPYRALLGCVAGNWHALGLRMLSDALRVQGWETFFLGANVPTGSFLSLAISARPRLIAVSCNMEDQIQELRLLLERLDAARRAAPELDYKIVAGGQYLNAHSEILEETPTDFRSRNLTDFLESVQTQFPSVLG